VLAAESGRKWWQFEKGREADVTVPPTAQTPAATASKPVEPQTTVPETSNVAEPERHWMISSPLGKVSWPRVHMPELPKPTLPTSPWPTKSEANPNRNTWAAPAPDPLKPSPIRRFGQSTRAAWDKTVDALTPGERSTPNDSSSRVARRDNRPAWKRMFRSNEPQAKEGSQTIGEFIAQERIDP
jgi:hypothetical protein